MTSRLVLAAVQSNPVLGAIETNEALARERLDQARGQGADLAVFTELFLSGYPPDDLALKPAVQRDCKAAIARLATAARASGLRSEADFARLGMDESLRRLSAYERVLKDVLAG